MSKGPKRLGILVLILINAAIIGWILIVARAEPVEAVTAKWSGSGHADMTSRAFRNWDQTNPISIPVNCAKCHSTLGYRDFLGEDGTEAGKVDNAAPVGTTIQCSACHNTASMNMASVTFPSQVQISDLDGQGNCMQCHQGRASAVQVNRAIDGLPADGVAEALTFVNVHYRPAAATRWGSEVHGGYEYPGKTYVGFFEHVRDYQTCFQCHDAHSLKIDPKTCSPCHVNVVGLQHLRDIRADKTAWSGPENASQGVAADVAALHGRLYAAIQDYARDVSQKPIVYSPQGFPYYYVDTDGDGIADADETVAANRYSAWTPRLLSAAYNYHFVKMDPGAFAHNPKHVIQLMYDSLADLGAQVPVDMSGLVRP